MPGERPSFRERDIRRAVRALEAEGKSVVRVEIEGGKLVIVTSEGGDTQPLQGRTEWRKRIGVLR